MTATVRKARDADTRQLAVALSKAFDDDPIMGWLFPKAASRQRRLPVVFEMELTHVHLRHAEVYTTEDLAGGAMWAPPDLWRTPPASLLRAMPRLAWALGPRIPAALRCISTIERVHPREPHWYLAILGTEPARQGQGIGSALIAPVLERCDREGLPAYLESSKESNIAFYGRHGFEVTRTIQLPGGGPPVWPMWRRPRS